MATLRAQYVSIPDAAFGTWLNGSGFSSCMTGNATSGWNLDTTCAAVVNATSMTVGLQGLQYLQGIQYFKNLTYLNLSEGSFFSSLPALPPVLHTFVCFDNAQLTSLPPLPATLQTLICTNNGQLSGLPALPASLTYIDCSMNRLDSLPALPDFLVYLKCAINSPIKHLPPLPASLTYLNCSDCIINDIPGLPPLLDTLICDGNMLATLPVLPNSLIYLNCMANIPFTTLPAMPQHLKYLNCAENRLTAIPFLPSSLNTFICFNIGLTGLPGLPDSLTYLDCSSNQLVFIPPLPDSLAWFDCSYNSTLTCLPHLNTVVHFNFTNTAVTCIPNQPTGNTYTNPTVPVCTGSQGCTAGINQLSTEQFTVYPNPASSHLMVENSGGINRLRLSNMLGQTVYTTTGNSQPVICVDVSWLQAGIYIIEAYNANGINTAKVIIGN